MYLGFENGSLQQLIDAQVYGKRGDWEKHEIGGNAAFVKQLATADAELKARIATRFHELGFVPMFFKEHGREFVALEGVREEMNYKTVEEAFVRQILSRVD